MYDLISGLSLYLERAHGFTNKLVSGAFRSVRNTLDNVMKERTAEGVGGGQRRTPSWKNMSKYCGKRVYWGRTVLTNLGGTQIVKSTIVKIDGKDALVYREFQSKTRRGDI